MRTYWRETAATTELSSADTVGAQLRKFRLNAHLSQGDVGGRLGYANINFMSMIENDRSGIPADRFVDFMESYEVPQNLRLDLFARCYSVHWEALKQLLV